MIQQTRAPRNQTICLDKSECSRLNKHLLRLRRRATLKRVINHTICQDIFTAARFLPKNSVDLLFLDPPYNLTKSYNGNRFSERGGDEYALWTQSWLKLLLPTLKPHASVYVCADWKTSARIYPVLEEHFIIQNRITWEREKGRGAKHNWKNALEDIWFCTCSDQYTFNVDNVKLKRKVIAPYRTSNGAPKDWYDGANGSFRLTHPSNVWTDLTIPFWSMPENTDHPTQKPEKLLAKLILASSNPGDVVLDPFLGSGTTSVVAKKLGRNYIGVEQEEWYCCLAEKRLRMAGQNKTIQGFHDGVFWERNTLREMRNKTPMG